MGNNEHTRGETWYFWQDTAHPPALNMALDEALLSCAAANASPILRFYQWQGRAVSIGYLQNFAAAPPGFQVVRRPTGGGVVYHDYDFTYTVAVPHGHWLTTVQREESYGHINRAVQRGLEQVGQNANLTQEQIPEWIDRRRMVCFENPTRYDIMANGRKIAGAAQRRLRDGIIHQGSIHFGTQLPYSREALGTAIRAGFEDEMKVRFQPFQPEQPFLQTAEAIANDKYAADGWNKRR